VSVVESTPETNEMPLDESGRVGVTPPGGNRAQRGRWWRRRVIVMLASLLVAAPAWSYARALTAPGSAPITNRTVEWLRDHGGASLVNAAEQWDYTRHQPSTKPATEQGFVLPTPPVPAPANADSPVPVQGLPAPTAVTPIVPGALPGEGQWAPAARSVDGRPTLLTTAYRPDAAHPGVVVAAVWIDTTVVRFTLVAGRTTPGGNGWAWDGTIPSSQRGRLLAAFNSGFRFQDIPGGFYAEGRQAIPLVDGQASLIIHTDGSATVGEWGRDARMTPDVEAVRQNLKLIVDGGRPVPDLTSNPGGSFGAPGQQFQYTWRSGLGVRADGSLVYVAGNDLTLPVVAHALVDAGAIRGMQLDIHPNNVSFNIFQPSSQPAGVTGTKLLATMTRPATRYLQPDQRDFIAVTVR